MHCLIGEPVFAVPWRSDFFVPFGQFPLCTPVLNESKNMGYVAEKLKEEYEAIACELKNMGINFHMVCRDLEDLDEKFVLKLHRTLGCKLAGFPGHRAATTLYPRDFCTVFSKSKTLLINPYAVELRKCQKDDWQITMSVYGEGGRILHSGTTALVGERLRFENGKPSRKVTCADILVLKNAGLKVGKVPMPVSVRYGFGGKVSHLSFNDHLDRIACLITGKDGLPHLIVDPALILVRKLSRGWEPRNAADTIVSLRNICEPMGIKIHVPKSMRVPYSLNLFQSGNGKVLMTSGDPDVQDIASDLVGLENLYTTAVPIRFFPVWLYAGIRCLINEAPEVMMIAV